MTGAATLLSLSVLCQFGAPRASLQLSVDRNEVSIEDQIVLRAIVHGSQSATPTLPDLSAFEVHARGRSTQMQIINGAASTSVTYTYILVPTRPGSFVVGPAHVTLDGETVSSRPFTLRVLPAMQRPKAARNLFIEVDVSTKTPYVGEQVIFTWRFFRRLVRLANASVEMPSFTSFNVEDLGEQKDYETNLGGEQFEVTEVKKALFAKEAGPMSISESTLTVDLVQPSGRGGSPFDDFFGRTSTVRKTLRSAAIELDVRPLPKAPPNFSGLVGQFELSSQLSKGTLRVGESATLSVTVRGTGNAINIVEPTLPDFSAFKVYDDKPNASIDRSDTGISATKTFRKALVALAPGPVTIESASLVYFDPQQQSYRTAASRPFALEIQPGTGKEDLRLTESLAPGTGKVSVKVLADDIVPNHRKTADLVANHLPWPLSLGLFLLPMGVFGLVAITTRRRQSFDANAKRRRQALGKSLQSLGRLHARGVSHPSEAAQEASRILRDYLGDKLGFEGGALTARDARERVQQRAASADAGEAVFAVLSRCEAAQYGSRADAAEFASISTELRGLLKRLDKELTS